ncbi:MAG: C10 family peptidase [Bacteroidales bacterium]|nr:C10 family peptidase [Bacteroidales bacterium]
MKKILLLLAVAMATLQMSAADVSLSRAQAAASAFLTKQVKAGRLQASAASNLQLAKAEASVAKPAAVDYYIFNSAKSYVVVAGDDLAPQILMYGEEGKLDLDNIPPAMQWLLNKYKFQIDGLKAGTLAPAKLPKFATTPVAPLVTANWDQSAPYNNQCPTSGSNHAVTGCPATSLAMCYYKWKWPETYPACAALSNTGGLSAAAISERAADWDNIIDEYTGPSNYSYTDAQANAVAWLMRYAGQSIPDYQYSTSASGANDPEIYQGCLNMGYTDAQYLLLTELQGGGWSGYSNGPQQYTDAEWNEFMLNELHNGRPIEYLAYDCSSYQPAGHAFNVFGVNASGQYYVNWGWSGDSNGYCTLHNFTTSTGATGQAGSYVFNYGEAMIIGIEPPAGAQTNPRITVNPATLTMNATVGTPETATFTVTGANLTSNVALSISGSNAFSLSTSSISANQAANGVTVTVTYNPSTVGTHEATVTLTSTDAETVTVKLNGTAEAAPLETYAPVMLDATDITATSFKATWTDQTPAENVESYTLYVSDKPFTPAVALLDTTDWSATNAVPTGWTAQGLTYYSSSNACYLSASANGYVQSKTYDLTGYNKMTVRVYAQPYNTGNTITVATSAGSKTVNVSDNTSFNWYTIVVDCASSDYVKLTTTGMPDLRYMKVYAGDLTTNQLKAAETGDATYRVITGIKDKSYTVTGLTQGGTFNFYVVANYTNGDICESNTNQVTLVNSDLEVYSPVMQPADEQYITLTSFRADWTDATPAENVASYTLEVSPKPTEPEIPDPVLLEDASFSSLEAATDDEGYLTNCASNATSYLPTGWTAQNGLWVNDGFIISGYLSSTTCGITSQTYDFTGYDKVTVVMSAYSYYASNYGTATMRIKTSAGSQDIALATDDFTTYTVVLDVAASDQIVFEGVENLFAIEDIKIYAGDLNAINNLRMASETGDANYRLITGITDKFYTVENLTEEGTFLYRVKALYADGTESAWSNTEEVTLFQNGHGYKLGDVNHSGDVTIADVTALIDGLLGDTSSLCQICADVNLSGDVTIADVTALIDMLLAGEPATLKMPKANKNLLLAF